MVKREDIAGLTSEEVLSGNKEQIEEALSPDNIWYAGERLGRSPTKEEAIMHYILNGGSDDYRKRHKK